MAFEPQRFIHAANIRLDVPVSVQSSEVLTDQLRLIYEDATLTSFDFLIQACITQKVDFLLLSGNVFVEADRSLRARLTMLNGFRQLEAKQIRVFVLPGDADPPEAWRAIPEMPPNVTVCYSSSPEPVELHRKEHLITTVSASMWYGETDAFGIRVITESESGVQPFRIGVISQSKYEESRRMAAVASTTTDDLLTASLQNAAVSEVPALPGGTHGTMVPLSGKVRHTSGDADPDLTDMQDEESGILPGVPPRGAHSGDHRTNGSEIDLETQDWDPGFVAYADETLREGRLNYLVYMGTMSKATLHRSVGIIHCPGTTQPRNYRETAAGSCSLVEVTADGSLRLSDIDTSTIDWKQIEIHVSSQTTLSTMLQTMKTRLMAQKVGSCDRIWSVHWTLHCAMPVLKELIQEDLAVAVAVELDELKISGRTIRLMHDVRLLPTEWHLNDSRSLAQRYSDIVSQAPISDTAGLQQLIDQDKSLTVGWRQKLTALTSGVEAEHILGRMRLDGAGWFIPDLSILDADSADSGKSADSSDDSPDEFTDDDAVRVLTERSGSKKARKNTARSVYEDEGDDSDDDKPDGTAELRNGQGGA